MNGKTLVPLALPGVALLGLGLVHATPSGTAPCPLEPVSDPTAPAGLVFGDVDGDGLDDAFVVGPTGQAHLLMNFGGGRFEDVTLAAGLGELGGATCALLADLDGDGDLDLFTGSSATRVWRNLGDGTFEPVTSGVEHDLVDLAIQAVDQDGDGRADLQVHTEAGDLVYRNLGEGRFERVELPLAQPVAHVGWMAPSKAGEASDAAGTRSPAERRLRRWSVGRTLGTSTAGGSSALTGGPLGGGPGAVFPLPACSPSLADAAGGCLEASSVPTLGKLHPISEDLFVDATTGFVGVGTTSPTHDLTIVGAQGLTFDVDGTGTREYTISTPSGNIGTSAFTPGGTRWDMQYGDGLMRIGKGDGDVNDICITDLGSVGVGTTSPQQKLEVVGGGFQMRDPSGTDYGHQITMSTPLSANNIGISMSRGNGSGGVDRRWDLYVPGGNSFRIRDGNAGADRLTIDTAGLVSVKQTLEIRGGADIVERFESSCGPLEPGTVVVIDPESPGALACSFDAYDTKVAGVVSGAGGVKPGIALGQDGVLDGETPVAMTGRVYVKCSTENGAIRPGDRLTTAALAGHAMRVTDEQRSVGSVIGKAMSSLEEGTGLVLVLVNLQ